MVAEVPDMFEPARTWPAAPTKPADELESVLDEFDVWNASQARPDDVVQLAEREAFARSFEALREGEIRVSLEEVAWRLEQRGHHSWIETGDESVATGDAVARPGAISLLVLAAGDRRDSAHAPRLRFTPNLSDRSVEVEATTTGDVAAARSYGRLRLETFERKVVHDMAVRFVGETFGAFRRLGGASAAEGADLEPGAWIPESDQPEGQSRDWT